MHTLQTLCSKLYNTTDETNLFCISSITIILLKNYVLYYTYVGTLPVYTVYYILYIFFVFVGHIYDPSHSQIMLYCYLYYMLQYVQSINGKANNIQYC